MTTQAELISLEDLVPVNYIYHKFTKLIDLEQIANKHLFIVTGKCYSLYLTKQIAQKVIKEKLANANHFKRVGAAFNAFKIALSNN